MSRLSLKIAILIDFIAQNKNPPALKFYNMLITFIP